jgi:uncharacterized DUF497 family protein
MVVRFARSATKHRISRESIRHVIANYRLQFEEPPPAGGEASQSTRMVYLGEDENGRALEVMAVEIDAGGLLVIHAMPQREKYRRRYEEGSR